MQIGSFASRHLGPREEDQTTMLRALGSPSLDDLIERTVPGAIRLRERLSVSKALTESEYLEHIDGLASQNTVFRNYIGMGYYPTEVPSVIRRNVLENPGWYTAYTPYQAEIAQGRLEALLNFQTMVMDLTGMEVANASLLDEGTAAAEAMAMLFAARPRPQVKAGKCRFLVDEAVFPQTLSVLRTRAAHLDIDMVVMSREAMRGAVEAGDVFGCMVQYPDANGEVEDLTGFVADMAEREVRTVFAADLMALLVLKSPGAMGADVVVGSSQRFGVPMGYGGPHAAFLRPAKGSSAIFQAESSASPSTVWANPPCAWPCKPANSTFDETRPRPTFAPPKVCWRSWRRCTPCTTDRRACVPSLSAFIATPAPWPWPWVPPTT